MLGYMNYFNKYEYITDYFISSYIIEFFYLWYRNQFILCTHLIPVPTLVTFLERLETAKHFALLWLSCKAPISKLELQRISSKSGVEMMT
jgi:hypothetical protein